MKESEKNIKLKDLDKCANKNLSWDDVKRYSFIYRFT